MFWCKWLNSCVCVVSIVIIDDVKVGTVFISYSMISDVAVWAGVNYIVIIYSSVCLIRMQ